MDIEPVTLCEGSQTEKEKYCMISLYMWNLKRNDTSELRKQTYGCQWEGIVRVLGKVMDTLVKWITNKDLLYSTWTSAQCYVPAWIREGFGGRMDTYG